jgi:hypothetical protein
MQIGNVYIKVVVRKLQGSRSASQFMILAGFNPKVTHLTCTNYETLSPNNDLTQGEVDSTIAKLVKCNSAQGYTDVTHPGVVKKLAKVLVDGDYCYG